MDHPYDTLTPDLVIDAVESCGYLSDARLLALNSYENRVYQVGLEEGEPLIAKFYRPQRWSREQILEEHQFSLELQDAGISVVAPLQNAQGQTLHDYGGFMIALFARRGGHPPELDNMDNLLVLGRTVGRIHAVGRSKPFTQRQDISIQRMAIDSYQYLAEHVVPAEMHAAYVTLSRQTGLLRAMETVANNLANMATTGFRREGAIFSEVVDRLETLGGSTSQTGARVRHTDFAQGSLVATGASADLAIQGSGFFILSNGTTEFYSRDGSFALNAEGFLMDPATGLFVQGYEPDATGVVNEGDKLGLHFTGAVLHVRAKHCVSLPKLIGVGFGERQSPLVFRFSVGFEQLVRFDDASESVRGNALTLQ